MQIKFSFQIFLISIISFITIMYAKNVVNIRDIFSSACENFSLNLELHHEGCESLCLRRFKAIEKPKFQMTQEVSDQELFGELSFAFEVDFEMKNYGMNIPNSFSFTVDVKNVSVDQGQEKPIVTIQNSLVFSFRNTPLHNYMSLFKQLGAFGIGISSFFDAVENEFKEKAFTQIKSEIQQKVFAYYEASFQRVSLLMFLVNRKIAYFSIYRFLLMSFYIFSQFDSANLSFKL